jgi:hypothetical protein
LIWVKRANSICSICLNDPCMTPLLYAYNDSDTCRIMLKVRWNVMAGDFKKGASSLSSMTETFRNGEHDRNYKLWNINRYIYTTQIWWQIVVKIWDHSFLWTNTQNEDSQV